MHEERRRLWELAWPPQIHSGAGGLSCGIVRDRDMISKVRAHCGTRKEQGCNLLTGRSAIADIQTPKKRPLDFTIAPTAYPSVVNGNWHDAHSPQPRM